MSYPYPELVPLLQFRCTAEEYLAILRNPKGSLPPIGDPFWQIIPSYTYAHCPICKVSCREPLNTYSLWNWRWEADLKQYVYDAHNTLLYVCKHFTGVHVLVNTNSEKFEDYFENPTGDIPYVTPWLVPEDIESYVVLHSLPICTVQQNKFQPTYTLYTLTYFSRNPKEVIERQGEIDGKIMRNDDEYSPSLISPPSYKRFKLPFGRSKAKNSCDVKYDLAQWAERGILGYLDYNDPNLPLVIGQGLVLPTIYQNIQGEVQPYTWQNGKRRFR